MRFGIFWARFFALTPSTKVFFAFSRIPEVAGSHFSQQKTEAASLSFGRCI
jgi:hypothetical protein